MLISLHIIWKGQHFGIFDQIYQSKWCVNAKTNLEIRNSSKDQTHSDRRVQEVTGLYADIERL